MYLFLKTDPPWTRFMSSVINVEMVITVHLQSLKLQQKLLYYGLSLENVKFFSKLPRTYKFIQNCWNETVDHMTKICFLVITGLNWQNRQKNLIYNITFIIKRLKSQFQNPNNLLFKAFIGKFKDIHIYALFHCLQDIENKHQIQIFYKKSVLKFIFEKPEK